MNPNGFPIALEELPVTSSGDSVKALVDLWYVQMTKAIDTSLLSIPLVNQGGSRVKTAPQVYWGAGSNETSKQRLEK